MADPEHREVNPLVRRVDELMRQNQEARFGGDTDLPVLTEEIDPDAAATAPPKVDLATVESIARMLERAVLERLAPEVDRVIEERLSRALAEQLAQALSGVRAELRSSVTQMVREAVANSVARAFAARSGGPRQP